MLGDSQPVSGKRFPFLCKILCKTCTPPPWEPLHRWLTCTQLATGLIVEHNSCSSSILWHGGAINTALVELIGERPQAKKLHEHAGKKKFRRVAVLRQVSRFGFG